MDTSHEDLTTAKNKLDAVNVRIDNHELNSSPMKEAREVSAQHRATDKAVVESELRRLGLPGPAAQTKALLFGLTSLARLNRKRIKLEGQVATLEAGGAR